MSFIRDLTRKLPPLPPHEPPPLSTYAPKPKSGPLQLGTVTLQNVDQLTSVSADEIEKAADQLVLAAHQTAELLRDAARRLRESGLFVNERLADFAKMANTCADAAKIMQRSVIGRNDALIAPLPSEDKLIETEDESQIS